MKARCDFFFPARMKLRCFGRLSRERANALSPPLAIGRSIDLLRERNSQEAVCVCVYEAIERSRASHREDGNFRAREREF